MCVFLQLQLLPPCSSPSYLLSTLSSGGAWCRHHSGKDQTQALTWLLPELRFWYLLTQRSCKLPPLGPALSVTCLQLKLCKWFIAVVAVTTLLLCFIPFRKHSRVRMRGQPRVSVWRLESVQQLVFWVLVARNKKSESRLLLPVLVEALEWQYAAGADPPDRSKDQTAKELTQLSFHQLYCLSAAHVDSELNVDVKKRILADCAAFISVFSPPVNSALLRNKAVLATARSTCQ